MGVPLKKAAAPKAGDMPKKTLVDLGAGRRPATRARLEARVRSLGSTQRATTAARNCALGLRKVCLEVIKKKGGATRG